jgi:DNA-binding IclR family transcriptional regulator
MAARRETAEVTSLEKGLELLQALASAEGSLTVAEIAGITHLNRTTAYRLCDVLTRGGWLHSIVEGSARGGRRVDLGPRALGLSMLAANKYPSGARLERVMHELAQQVGETIHAGVLEGQEVVHVARAVPEHGPHMAVKIGARAQAHATALGKAMLATFDRADVLRLYRDEQLSQPSPNALASRTALLEELERVRVRGVAYDDQESRTGVFCIGAPVFGSGGTALFALSVTTLPVHVEGERLPAVEEALREAAASASAAFGGRPPASWGQPRNGARSSA